MSWSSSSSLLFSVCFVISFQLFKLCMLPSPICKFGSQKFTLSTVSSRILKGVMPLPSLIFFLPSKSYELKVNSLCQKIFYLVTNEVKRVKFSCNMFSNLI